MKEQLITFETAKLAKEKEFDIPCRNNFDITNEIHNVGIQNHNLHSLKFSAPTQALLQKWLREMCNIEVIPSPRYNNDNLLYYCYEIIKPKICSIEDINKNMFRGVFTLYDTYEQALEAGLQEALKLI